MSNSSVGNTRTEFNKSSGSGGNEDPKKLIRRFEYLRLSEFLRSETDRRKEYKKLEIKVKEAVNLREELGNLDSKIEKYDDKARDNQVKAIEALGIFVALFSFISINIQIFSRVSSARSAGVFMLLIFLALSSLIVLMDLLLIRHPENSKKLFQDSRFYLMLSFLVIGAVLTCFFINFPLNPVEGTIEFDEVLNNKLDQKVKTISDLTSSTSEVTAKHEIQMFKDCISKNGSMWPCIQNNQ